MEKVNLTPWALSLAISLAGARAAAVDRCDAADLSGLQKKVYVKPDGKDVDGCGTTPDNACLTIQRGIERCSGSGCGVLVRHGQYELKATIALASGVSVYGSCELGVDGTAPAPPYRSVILAPPDGKAAISATKITTRTVLHGFNVLGSEAKTLGAPSIGVIVKDSPGEGVLVLQYCQIAAGKGAPGAPGNQPGGPPTAGDGQPGSASNTMYPNKYCTNALDVCEYIEASGGGRSASGQENGGAGGVTRLKWHGQYSYYCDWDSAIQKGQPGNGSHGGSGGDGTVPGAECTGHLRPGDGQPGLAGSTRPCNGPSCIETLPSGCARQGGVTSTDRAGVFDKTAGTWAPSRSGRGDSGPPGSGGGGGGSGGSCIASGDRDGAFIWFASGGGGGAGGQGGPGGEGGLQGGPSFALVVINSNLQGTANRFIQGPGGKGGRGGDGAPGGAGGKGGPGAKGHFDTVGDFNCPGYGADGGGGSPGGPGAGGAGGNGGPSIGLALVGGQAPDSLARIYLSQAGEGGTGGIGNAGVGDGCQNDRAPTGNTGSQGIAERIHKY